MQSPTYASDIDTMEHGSDIDAMEHRSDIDAMEHNRNIDGFDQDNDSMEIDGDQSVGGSEQGEGSPVSMHPCLSDTLEQGDPEDSRFRGTVPVTRRAGHLKTVMTHSQARDATCVLCWRKGDLLVNNDSAIKIRTHTHHTTFDLDNLSHPSGLCRTCKRNLDRLDSGNLGKRKDPRPEWRKKQLHSILIPDGTVASDICSVSGCPICCLARFNPIAKPGPKCIVNSPILDPECLLEADTQERVQPQQQYMSCRLCAAPYGPGLPHPHCPMRQEERRKGGKEKKKQEMKRRVDEEERKEEDRRMEEEHRRRIEEERRRIEEEELRRGMEENIEVTVREDASGKKEKYSDSVKVARARMNRTEATTRDRLRDMILQRSVKAQETILADMLVRTGAARNLKDSFKLELSRPQGGRPLEVTLHIVQCTSTAFLGPNKAHMDTT